MRESFGVRLRQQRERQEVALATIAEQTKIKLSLLQELERDDISHWPTGIFRRAFVRCYAAAIGLDPEVAVREFLEQFPEPVEVVEPVQGENGGAHDAPAASGPPTRLRYFVGSLLARFRGESPETELTPPFAATQPSILVTASSADPEAAPAFEPPHEPEPAREPEPPSAVAATPDLQVIARVCTDFGRLDDIGQVAPLLEEAAELLGAVGLIVWVWESKSSELMPVLTHGYSDYVLALVPKVKRESDNATAAAFRTAQTCVVSGSEHASGALVVPLTAPGGCIGVLAIELKDEAERQPSVRAFATILAAQLARLIDAARPLETAGRRFA